MSPIQYFLLFLLGLSLVMSLLVLRNQIFGRLFFAAQFLAGIAFVLVPDLSTRLASFLGIGRGTDMLLYFIIMLFYVSSLLFMAKIRRIERAQTAIIREMAISNAIDNSNINKNKETK